MSETQFGSAPPQNGSRVEVVHGTPPRSYVVKSWVNGQLVDEKAFSVEADAKQYQVTQAKRLA